MLEIIPRGLGRTRFRPNAIQRKYMAARTPRDIVLKGRRVGMSTEGIARDLWHFATKPGSNVVITCQSDAAGQGKAAVLDILEPMLSSLEQVRHLEFVKRERTDYKLANGSRLRVMGSGASRSAAQKAGRAGAVTRLHATEVAFWGSFAGETMTALLPCVAEPQYGTEIEIESTPNGAAPGDRGDMATASGAALFHWRCSDAAAGLSEYAFHFYEWWNEPAHWLPLEPGEVFEPRTDREKWYAERGLAPEQLKFYRKQVEELGDKAEQEYPSDKDTCFLVSGRCFFDVAVLKALLLAAVPKRPLEVLEIRAAGAYGALRIYRQPEPGKSYVVGGDTSEGTGGDPAAGIVRERGTGLHMATLHGQFKPKELARALAGVGRRYNGATIAVERNNHGHACLLALDIEQHYPRVFEDEDEKPGFCTSPASRPMILDSLEDAVRNGHWKSADAAVLSQMTSFVINHNGRPEAQTGANDDLVLAEAITWEVLRRSSKTPRVTGQNRILPF